VAPNLLTLFGVLMMGMAMGSLLTATRFHGMIRQLRQEQEEPWPTSGPRLVASATSPLETQRGRKVS
jgi:hypothetical protein